MLQVPDSGGEDSDFYLKDRLKAQEMDMLQFLYNSEFHAALEHFEEKTAVHTEARKYHKSVGISSEEMKLWLAALSEKLHKKLIGEDYESYKALNKLETLWEARRIETFHRYYFEKYVSSNNNLRNVMTLIRNEEHLVRANHHVYYSIEKVIWAREACLNHLRRLLKSIGSQDLYEHLQTLRDRELERKRRQEQKSYKVYGYPAKYNLDERETKLERTQMQGLSEDLNGYRRLTFMLIQLVSSWKLYIQSLTPDPRQRRQKLSFYYKEHNLYLSILNDANFISTSFLSNFYTFAVKNDPFLLKPIFNHDAKIISEPQVSFETSELKKIINCKLKDLPRMMTAEEQLYQEVEWGLTHKKYFDKKGLVLYKSAHFKGTRSEAKLPSMKQAKLITQKSQSSKKLPLGLTLRKQQSSTSNFSLGTLPRSRSFRINNPQSKMSSQILESEQLRALKSSIYKKVKEELEYETKKSILGSRMFSDRVDEQVRIGFTKHLQEVEAAILENSLEVTPLSFSEEQISSYITQIYKQMSIKFKEMQVEQSDLLKSVLEENYCYILKVHTKQHEVANVVAFVNHQITEYKSVQIQFISFKLSQTFQRVVLKVVQFFWKYDNAKEIVLNLRFSTEEVKAFVKENQKKLEQNCTIIEKKYKSYVESKFVFTNSTFNKNFSFFPHPEKAHFKLYSALCVEKVQLESREVNNLSRQLHYDYLIMEVLKRFTNSEDFITLRDTFKTKDRLRFLLNQLMQIEKNKEFQIDLTILEAQNLTELNNQLQYLKKPLLKASDLVLINNIKLLQLEYTLTVAYQLKVLSTWDGQRCHRYAIHEDLDYLRDNAGSEFYFLPVQETHHLRIIVFTAQNFLKNYQKGLNMYLFQTLEGKTARREKKFVDNLWIEMLRYPAGQIERGSYNLNSYRVHQFESTSKELIVGDSFDWSSDIHIQNGLQYQLLKEDIHLRRPLGVGVVTNSNWILYCRIFPSDLADLPRNV